jgi:hypothetical protein
MAGGNVKRQYPEIGPSKKIRSFSDIKTSIKHVTG